MLWPGLIWCMYKVARKSLKICRLLEARQSSKKIHLQSRPSITSQKDSKHLDEQKKFYAQLPQDQSLPNTFCGFEDTWHLREIRSQKAFPSDRLRRGSRGKTNIRTRMSIRPNILSIKDTRREYLEGPSHRTVEAAPHCGQRNPTSPHLSQVDCSCDSLFKSTKNLSKNIVYANWLRIDRIETVQKHSASGWKFLGLFLFRKSEIKLHDLKVVAVSIFAIER